MDKTFEEKISWAMASQNATMPSDLADKIIVRIKEKQRLAALVKMAVFGVLSILAMAIGVWVWYTQSSAIVSSEVVKLLSLAFSDTAVVLNFWKEYSLSLLESIPFISIAFLLVCLWTLFASMRITIKNGKILFNHAHQHA